MRVFMCVRVARTASAPVSCFAQAILAWMDTHGHDSSQFVRDMDAAIVKTIISIQRLSTAACRKVF